MRVARSTEGGGLVDDLSYDMLQPNASIRIPIRRGRARHPQRSVCSTAVAHLSEVPSQRPNRLVFPISRGSLPLAQQRARLIRFGRAVSLRKRENGRLMRTPLPRPWQKICHRPRFPSRTPSVPLFFRLLAATGKTRRTGADIPEALQLLRSWCYIIYTLLTPRCLVRTTCI